MIRRTTWIVTAIFIILLGIGWYILHVKPATQTLVSSTPPPAKLLTGLTVGNIKAIKYIDDQGVEVSLGLQSNNQWIQTSPSITPLSTGNIQEIITQLLDMNVLTELTTPPAVETVGLDKPAYTFIITTDKDIIFNIGNQTPIGSGYYVQVSQQNPTIIDKPTVDSLIALFKSTQYTPTPQITSTLTQETPTPTSTGY